MHNRKTSSMKFALEQNWFQNNEIIDKQIFFLKKQFWIMLSASRPTSQECQPVGLGCSSQTPSTQASWWQQGSCRQSSSLQRSPPSRCCGCGRRQRSKWHCPPKNSFTFLLLVPCPCKDVPSILMLFLLAKLYCLFSQNRKNVSVIH